MKKIISLFLALVMCLSLCACGGSNTKSKDPTTATQNHVASTEDNTENSNEEFAVSTEEVLENAIVINAYNFYQEAAGNIVRAENEYNEKAVLFWDQIIEIQKEYVVVGKYNTQIKVFLTTEDIMEVSMGQYVLVAGMVNNISLGQNFSLPYVSMDMPQGYLVKHSETDNAALYNNAKKQLSEANYVDAIFVLKTLNGYSDSGELLLEAVCKAKYNNQDDNNEWKLVFDSLNCDPLNEAEIAEVIVGNWYSSERSSQYSNYTENGEYHYFMGGQESNPNSETNWWVENGRLVRESQYTRSEYVIFHFYKNAYVFLSPRAYNQVTDDVYELYFLNGPVE